MTFFDTADMYSDGASEEITGRLLRRLFPRRDDYVLATKVYYPMGPGPTTAACPASTSWPPSTPRCAGWAPTTSTCTRSTAGTHETPIEETMEALHDVVAAGKARYIGASSMYAWQFAKAQYTARAAGWTRFVSMQNHYNLVYREEEREMLPLCRDQGVGVIPYSPLARGLLAAAPAADGPRGTDGAGGRGGARPVRHRRRRGADAAEIATERGLPPARVALAWLLGRPGVTRADRRRHASSRHVDDAVAAVDLTLTEEEVAALEAPYRPHEPFGY